MTIETHYVVEVKNTDKLTGASDGWGTACSRPHNTMIKAIACKESALKRAQDAYNVAPPDLREALDRNQCETRIAKVTREIVESAEEFIPAK